MLVKVLGTFVLLGFMYAQLVTSLDCYSCDNASTCANPGLTTCTNATANATTLYLHRFYQENLTSLASSTYECFSHNLTLTTSLQNVTYKGCIYNRISPCTLTIKEEFKPVRYQACYKCTTSRCNYNSGNPAGTFSSSSFTIFTTIVVLAILRIFKL